jgi:hypothetical protein
MANNLTYEIIMDAAQVETMLARTAEAFPGYIDAWLHESAVLTQAEMSANAPEGVAGLMGQGLKNNIGIDYNLAEGSAEIKPTDQVPYADAVETGSRPHRPPAGPDSALAQWCELKGLNVWAVAKSIERKGTQPHPYIEPTYQTIKPQVSELFSKGVGQYLARVSL